MNKQLSTGLLLWAAVWAWLASLHATHAYQLDVDIQDMPFYGPLKDPKEVEKRWGSKENWKKGEAVVYLNDDTFEHRTQAASGYTTGDWLVMVGAPWCPACKAAEANWNHTARELFGEINVAYIDGSTNPFTQERFKVTRYPTIFLLHKGRAYEYKGDRYWRKMVLFARMGYEEVESFEIPPAHGTFDELVVRLQKWSGDMYAVYEERPDIFFASLLFGGGLSAAVLGYIVCAPYEPSFIELNQPDKPQTKVWDANANETRVLETVEEEEEHQQTGREDDISLEHREGVRQLEVDADTVEIVTGASDPDVVAPAETSQENPSTKARNKGKSKERKKTD